MRIAPDTYSIDDRLAVKTIYGHGSKFEKSAFYSPFGSPDKANIFTERVPHRHAMARRQVASLYSMSTMVSYEQFVDRCTDVLMAKLKLFADKKQLLDIPTWMQFYVCAPSSPLLRTCSID